MAAVEVLQNVSCKSPDQVSEGTKEHQIYSKKKQHKNTGFVGQDICGEHSQPIDNDLYINKLQKKAHQPCGLFFVRL